MGGTLQKILPGRGDQERQSYRLKRSFALLLLVASWLFLLANFTVARPVVWFPLSVATALFYAFLVFGADKRELSAEFLLSVLVVLTGIISALKLPWLKLVFFPLVIAVVYY